MYIHANFKESKKQTNKQTSWHLFKNKSMVLSADFIFMYDCSYLAIVDEDSEFMLIAGPFITFIPHDHWAESSEINR